jgi:PAS domain S-box-containing protein
MGNEGMQPLTDEWIKKAELLRRSKLQEQISAVAEAVPGFIFTIRVEPDGHTSFPFASSGVEELFGLRPDEIRADAAVLRNRYHPDDLPRILELMEETERTLAPFRIEIRIFHPVHGERWIEIRSTPQRQPDGATEWHGVMLDITERKRTEEALQRLNRELMAISNCNQTLVRATDEQTLLNDICHIICDEAGYRLVWVGYVEHDDAKTVRPAACAGRDDGYVANADITWADNTERGHGPTGRAIRSGETVYFQNVATDPRMAPWRENALQRGYSSGIALPLKDENAQVFGVLMIYSGETDAFTPDEIRLLEELAGDLAFGIMVLRIRAERNRYIEALLAKQQKMTDMAVELSMAEERERRRIAAELHDHISQTLLLGKIKLRSLICASPAAIDRNALEALLKLQDQMIRSVRSLTQQLSPPILARAGLEAALEWLGACMKEDYGLRVVFIDDRKPKPLTEDMRAIVYHACRELLINVAKHAETDSAWVAVAREGDRLCLTVEDRGVGFDLSGISTDGTWDRGFGLFNIHERIKHLKGEVTLASAPGKGTRVTLCVALAESAG